MHITDILYKCIKKFDAELVFRHNNNSNKKKMMMKKKKNIKNNKKTERSNSDKLAVAT